MPDPKKKPIIVNSKNDSRYKAYQDSLTAYNRDIAFDKELIELVKRKGTITEKERQLLDKKYPLNNVKPKKEYGLNKAPILFTGDKGYKVKDLMVFKKPQQPVIFEQKLQQKNTNKDSLDLYNKGEKNKTKGAKEYPYDKTDNLVITDKNSQAYKDYLRTGIMPTKEYVKGNKFTYGYDKPKESFKIQPKIVDTPQVTPLQQLQTQGVVNQNQSIEAPLPIFTPQAQIPKSWNIDYSAQRMNNNVGYYNENNRQGVDIETAIRAKEQADRYNESIQKKYQNSKNPKAIERLNTLKDTVTITPQYAYGGQLNNNMQNNNLTRFNEGGLHSENKFGGIPIGGNNTVEEGETKLKNYVYSNRIAIDENMTKEMNLPSYIKGKTFADASKAIDNKFKDRNDKHSLETKNVFLDRLKQAQEILKQQEQQKAEQIAQSMQSNQQQIPDMMNGEVPEGMEQFTEQNQMFMGGDFNIAEVGNITGGLAGLAGKASPYLGAAATGAQAGSMFGPVGMGIGAAVGLGSSIIGANKAKKQQALDLRNNANAANLTDNFAYGGKIKQMYDGGDTDKEDPTNPLFKPTNTIPQVGAGKPSDFLGYNIKPKNILPKPPTADMNTNIIQNFQDGLGMDPKTPGYGVNFGKQSNQLYFNDRIKRDPEYAAAAKKKGLTTDHLTNSDFTSDNISETSQKRFGLTPQGYKYLDPETPDTSMLKPQEQPFVEPTGVQAGMEAYYQKNKTTTTSDTQNNQGNWLDRNGGKILKYAPIAANALQLANLKKPAYTRLDRLTNRFKPEYVDEAQLQNIANNEMNNSVNSISQIGGSQGAVRNAILGASLNKTKALSNAYMDASAQNRQTNMAGQQFNLGVDQANIGQANQELDINDRNQANYRNEKSKYLASIGTDLGSIGKEEVNKNQIADAFGYSWDGKYMIDKKTGEKKTFEDVVNQSKQAYGGYLKMNKIGRK